MNMTRRQALKSIALGSGLVISSSSIIGMLNTAYAQSNNVREWQYLSSEQAHMLEQISHVIIPSSKDVPGAEAVATIPFLDMLFAKLLDEDEQQKFKKGMQVFDAYCEKNLNSNFVSLSNKQQTEIVYSMYNLPAKLQEQMLWLINGQNKEAKKDDQYYLYSFLFNLRSIVLEAYVNSQLVGEKVLAYDQVPGNYEDMQMTASTRAWSLS
ncbi:gluconate 2-dehydrogenase subunit 3 family protein [Glaciecola sp. 1036]|uniref:gluconate 2-dehydrogenase subunit 3 family protein n=1 Tax=Alteromonadaceae TaxID=72275 RepID=UPI003CFC0646